MLFRVGVSRRVALLVDQPESPVLIDWLDQASAVLVSSDPLETKLHRIAAGEALDNPT